MIDILHLYTCTEDGPTLTTQVVMPTPTTRGSTTRTPKTVTTSARIDTSTQGVTPTSSPEHAATSTGTPRMVTTSARIDTSTQGVTPTSSPEHVATKSEG